MEFISDRALEERLNLKTLINALRISLQGEEVKSPDRTVLQIALPDGSEASLLLMPVWREGEGIVVKAVTYFPGNNALGLPTIHAAAIAFDGSTGELQAMCDADILTARRTAAGSALAADYLARRDAKRLLLIGTGQLSHAVACAHALIREYEVIEIWGRDVQKADLVVHELKALGLPVQIASDLRQSCQEADVISSVTSAREPVILGDWIGAGTHVDLIGSFRADMRESDDDLISKASLFVDTVSGALRSGDLAQPIASGVMTKSHIKGDLKSLVQGRIKGRQTKEEVTVFKSAGFALEDYVAMKMAEK